MNKLKEKFVPKGPGAHEAGKTDGIDPEDHEEAADLTVPGPERDTAPGTGDSVQDAMRVPTSDAKEANQPGSGGSTEDAARVPEGEGLEKVRSIHDQAQ